MPFNGVNLAAPAICSYPAVNCRRISSRKIAVIPPPPGPWIQAPATCCFEYFGTQRGPGFLELPIRFPNPRHSVGMNPSDKPDFHRTEWMEMSLQVIENQLLF